MYFDNITKASELKQRYKDLAKTMHPDKGGNVEEFYKMQNEYENVLKSFLTSKKSIITKQEAVEFASLLERWLHDHHKGIWTILQNVATQPLAQGLFGQFATPEMKDFYRMLKEQNVIR